MVTEGDHTLDDAMHTTEYSMSYYEVVHLKCMLLTDVAPLNVIKKTKKQTKT